MRSPHHPRPPSQLLDGGPHPVTHLIKRSDDSRGWLQLTEESWERGIERGVVEGKRESES